MDYNLVQLTVVTLSASSASVLLGTALRAVLRRIIGGSSGFVDRFTSAATTAFILVVCTFEKMLPFIAGSELIYYVMTFMYGIAFARVFIEFSPSPCTPLFEHWKDLNREFLFSAAGKRQSFVVGLYRSILYFLKVSFTPLLGLFAGYQIAVFWLKFLWDGMMTSHHVDNMPVLDSCVESLNTDVTTGFLLEFAVTLFFLEVFSFIDSYFQLHRKSTPQIIPDSIKSLIVVIVLYICIDITGAFANPFLAYVIQRHCLTDMSKLTDHLIVYLAAPLFASILHLIIRDSLARSQKQKK